MEEEAKLYRITGELEIREKILRQTIEFCRNNMLIQNAEKLELLIDGK